jgi:hypothetical protein
MPLIHQVTTPMLSTLETATKDIVSNNICPVCLLRNTILLRGRSRDFELHCARCGDYDITHGPVWGLANALANLAADDPRRPIIAEWIWYQNSVGIIPEINKHNWPSLLARPRLPFFERAKRLLLYLADNTKRIGTRVTLGDPRIMAMLQTIHFDELTPIWDFLGERRWAQVRYADGDAGIIVTGDGFIQAEEWKQTVPNSIQGFVAMWFNDDLKSAWDQGFQPAIERAGYRAMRIDKKEHANKICDEIIAEIRRSRFVVADYTGHRGGVYYEAGYATGRDLPVILTCRKDELNKLHFDVRQFNCIDWQSPDELAQRLQARIEALFGDGPLKK